MTAQEEGLDELRDKWLDLYKNVLPGLAREHSPVQKKWPVRNDHCFARIILDCQVGKTVPWTKVLKSPAYKNLDCDGLRGIISLGEAIASGEENLDELNQRSLSLRGK